MTLSYQNERKTEMLNESSTIASKAITEAKARGATSPAEIEEAARKIAFQACSGHEVAIYYDKAIQFCAENDTSAGEQWLGAGPLDEYETFKTITCSVAFKTLLVHTQEIIHDICENMKTKPQVHNNPTAY